MNGFLLQMVLRRIFLGALTLAAVTVVVFFATQVMPGDAARAILGKTATPERLAEVRAALHLDRPVADQFWAWVSGIAAGHPGSSLVNGRPVSAIVYPRAVNSATLLALTAVVGVPVSLGLGVAAGMSRGRAVDTGFSALALAVAALPEFVVGILLILLLSTTVLHLLPAVSLVPPGGSVFDQPVTLVLPVITLCVVCFPYIFRMTRATMIDVLGSEYIEMARLKGVRPGRLVLVHALPNALPPIVQVVALTLAYLAGGVVLVEVVFGYPGIGQGLLDAIVTRDVPVIQFIVLLLAAVYIALNLAADLAAMALTPKLSARPWQRP